MAIDWTKVKFPEKKKTKRYQAGELSSLDHYKLLVVSKLLNKSVASIIQTAVYTYMNRNWDDHLERLEAEASIQNKSVEELFSEMCVEDEK